MSAATFTGHLPGDRAYRRLIAGLFFAGIATFAQLYSPQAVLPLIAAEFDVPPATAALAVSMTTLGLAVTVIPWSAVADRVGRVPAMAAGILIATVFGLLAPFSPDISTLLVLRLLEGVGLGAVPAIALAYLSEEVDAAHTAAAAGSYIAGTTIGGLAGRLVAGPVGDVAGWEAGVLAVAVVCALSAVAFLVLVPRARGFVALRHRPHPGPSLAHRLAENLRSRRQLALYAQGFLLMGGFVALYNYLGFALTAPPYAMPHGAVSLLFLAYLAGTAASPVAGSLASRFGRFPVLTVSTAVMAAGAALTLVPPVWTILVGLLVFTAGFFAAHARVTNAMLPLLRASASPRIVNMSSTVGSMALQTTPGVDLGPVPAAYLASKTFLNAFTVQYAKELRGSGILINAGCPGFTATGLNGFSGDRSPQQGAAIAIRLATLPADGPTGGFFDDAGAVSW